MDGQLTGKLLVASPLLPDPNFDRTVVLLIAHGPDGALGVVLNRPSDTELAAPLPQWERLAVSPPVVFVGGPVNSAAAICLARVAGGEELRSSDGSPGWTPVAGDVGTFDLELDPDEVTESVLGLRVFAGYAGWGAGQLEGEIEAEAWWVVDARPEDALHGDPEQLWRQVLRRQRGSLALMSAYPPDPAMN